MLRKSQPKQPNTAFEVNILGKKETNLVLEVAAPLAAQLALIPLPPSGSRGAEPYLPRRAIASERARGCESGTYHKAAKPCHGAGLMLTSQW